MAMNREVFLSILAMDSYQRGYAPGINGLPQFANGVTVKIGNATLSTNSEAKLGASAEAAGFYALSYTWGAETVISYRGTDFDIDTDGKSLLNTEFWKDLSEGWTSFLLIPPVPNTPLLSASLSHLLPKQFPLAEQFFNFVLNIPAGQSAFEIGGVGPVYSNVIVTGHSLGGALAGYVDARVDVKSYLVDPIPYAVNDNTCQWNVAA